MRLQEADYGLTEQAFARNGGRRGPNPDENLRVSFSLFPSEDQDASSKEGRPIFKDEVYITIMIPGERDFVHRQAWEKDYERFPQQYAAFKNKQNQDTASGTPLKVIPWLTNSQIKELEYFNCFTVEQLANMPDSTAQKFLQVNKLKQQAKDYLEAAKGAAPLVAMREELTKRDTEIEVLQRQVKELSAMAELFKTQAEKKK